MRTGSVKVGFTEIGAVGHCFMKAVRVRDQMKVTLLLCAFFGLCSTCANGLEIKGLKAGMTLKAFNEVTSKAFACNQEPEDMVCKYRPAKGRSNSLLDTIAESAVRDWEVRFFSGELFWIRVKFSIEDFALVEQALTHKWGKGVTTKSDGGRFRPALISTYWNESGVSLFLEQPYEDDNHAAVKLMHGDRASKSWRRFIENGNRALEKRSKDL